MAYITITNNITAADGLTDDVIVKHYHVDGSLAQDNPSARVSAGDSFSFELTGGYLEVIEASVVVPSKQGGGIGGQPPKGGGIGGQPPKAA